MCGDVWGEGGVGGDTQVDIGVTPWFPPSPPPPPRLQYGGGGGVGAGPPPVLRKRLRLGSVRLYCQELPHCAPPVCHQRDPADPIGTLLTPRDPIDPLGPTDPIRTPLTP